MSTKTRTIRAARRKPTPKRTAAALPSTKLNLTDRNACAWQDYQGTWRGKRDADVSVHVDAPMGFHISAVLQPENPYLWVGIAAPDTLEARTCYAIVGAETLRSLATDILRCLPKKARTR